MQSLTQIAEDDYPTDMFDAVNENIKGAFWDGEIWKWNRGGVIVRAGECKGFMPYRMMDASRLEGVQNGETIDGSQLLRQKIRCIVKKVDLDGKALVSEREYLLSRLLDYYKPGDVIKVRVTGKGLKVRRSNGSNDAAIEAYGVFVEIPSQDGAYHGVPGFIHKSELAWDFVTRPETIVQKGHRSETKNLFLECNQTMKEELAFEFVGYNWVSLGMQNRLGDRGA